MKKKVYLKIIKTLKEKGLEKRIVDNLKYILKSNEHDLFKKGVEESFKKEAEERMCKAIIHCAVRTNCMEVIGILYDNVFSGNTRFSLNFLDESLLTKACDENNLRLANFAKEFVEIKEA